MIRRKEWHPKVCELTKTPCRHCVQDSINFLRDKMFSCDTIPLPGFVHESLKRLTILETQIRAMEAQEK